MVHLPGQGGVVRISVQGHETIAANYLTLRGGAGKCSGQVVHNFSDQSAEERKCKQIMSSLGTDTTYVVLYCIQCSALEKCSEKVFRTPKVSI